MKQITDNKIISADYPDYLHDESRVTAENVSAVLWPESENDVIDAVNLASEEKMPVTVSAARTGIVAGAVPLSGGMILSMEKLTKMGQPIFDDGKNEWFMIVGPGALLQDIETFLHNQNDEKLFYPPDPTEMSAAIGGTVATNASGARTYKYGATRNYIRRLRIVLSDGNVLEIKRGQIISDENNELN